MLCNVGEILARAYLRSRASFQSARDREPIENVAIQRRNMNVAKQKADVHARTCKICDAGVYDSLLNFGSMSFTSLLPLGSAAC